MYEITLWKRGNEISYEKLCSDELAVIEAVDWNEADMALKEDVENTVAEAKAMEDKEAAYKALREVMQKIEGRVEYIACSGGVVSCYIPEGTKGQLVVATYTEDMLSFVKSYPVDTKKGEFFSEVLPEIPDRTRLKIMLWDDFDNLEPHMEYITK